LHARAVGFSTRLGVWICAVPDSSANRGFYFDL